MEALGNLGSFFSGPAGKGLSSLATLGATGAGLYGNISAEQQRQNELNILKKQQAAAEVSPTQLAQQVSAATQPLNRGLVQDVTNNVSGTLAEQGLSQAPGIQATALSQALAPYQQQNQATALQLVMKRLGLPIEYAQTLLAGNPQSVDLSKLLALLGRPGGGSGTGTAAASPAIPPAQADWMASLPGITPTTPPGDPGLPDWLTSAPSTAPAFGG